MWTAIRSAAAAARCSFSGASCQGLPLSAIRVGPPTSVVRGKKDDINDPDRHRGDFGAGALAEARANRASGAAGAYRRQQAGEAHGTPLGLEPLEVLLPGTTAMETLIEKKIQASQAAGAFDNLKGAGKPLPHRHEDQFARVDPLVSAMTRAMGAADIKPVSIELRDELAEARADFAAAVRRMAARSAEHRERILTGTDTGLQVLWNDVLAAHKRYNNACLTDKEMWGAGWPLNPLPKLAYEAEVRAALNSDGSAPM